MMSSKDKTKELHEHDHEHDHNHAHGQSEHSHEHRPGELHSHAHMLPGKDGKLGLAFKVGFMLTAGFVVVEFTAGILTNSLALISDAGHNLTDALALAFSWWALRLAKRAPTSDKTYGYHRAGILAATLNAATLIVISCYIFYEGVERLLNPPEVNGWSVVAVATVALLVNLTVAFMLMGWSKNDLNTKSAYLHIVGDAAASVGVIIGGLLQAFTGWRYTDPLISMLIGGLILWSSWGVLKEATNILLEGSPVGLDMVRLMRDLMSQSNVKNVHDLHVWTIGSGFRALSCHLELSGGVVTLQDANQAVREVNQMLRQFYDIRHSTIQVDYSHCGMTDVYCFSPSGE